MRLFKFLVAGLITAGLLIPVATAFGAEFVAPQANTDGNIVLPSTETRKNLYVAGGSVSVDSTVEGDLYVAGGMVTVNGKVTQDVVAVGGTVILNGEVGGDVRVAGGTLQINSRINGDLLLAGGTVSVASKAFIGGDLVAGSGDLHLDAPVAGVLRVGGGNLYLNSEVKGSAWIWSEDSVTFASGARMQGQTSLKTKLEPQVQEGAQFAVPLDIKKIEGRDNKAEMAFGALWVSLLAAVFSAFILAMLFPKPVQTLVDKSASNMGRHFGMGIGWAILMPILFFVSLVTVIGYWFGFLILAVFTTLMILASIVADIWFGALLIRKLTSQKLSEPKPLKVDWQSAVLGAGVLTLIGFIPLVGWIVVAGFTLISFGAMLDILWENRKAPAVPTVVS